MTPPTDEVKGGQTRSKITPRCNGRVQAKFRLHDVPLYLDYTKTPMTDVLAVAFTPTGEVKRGHERQFSGLNYCSFSDLK